MTTADPISLAQAKRLAANADTILLRATRPADLETPIGAFLRLDDGGPGLPARIRRGRRAARPLLVPRRRAAPAPRGPRRPGPDPDAAGDGARLRRRTCRSRRRRRRPARRRSAPSSRVAASSRPRACRASPAAPSAPWPTTPSRPSSRRVPLPERDPVGVPTAAFIETDLVLVFDHLTHTLSAIASLHTETPGPRGPLPDRRGGDLRGARADVAARRGRARRGPPSAGARRDGTPAAARRRRATDRSRPASAATSTSTPSRSAKDAIAAGEAIQVVLARRQSFDLPTDPSTGATARRDRRSTGRSAGSIPSPYLFFVRTPGFEVVGASPGAPPPGRGRQADDAPDRRHAAARRRRPARTRSSPSSSSATRRSAPST